MIRLFTYLLRRHKLNRIANGRLVPKKCFSYPEYCNYIGHLADYEYARNHLLAKSVLDLGCGSRYGTHLISSIDEKIVIGVDKDETAIKYAIKEYGSQGTIFLVVDAENLAFNDETFDTVICFQIIEHIDDHRKSLSEIKRILEKTTERLFLHQIVYVFLDRVGAILTILRSFLRKNSKRHYELNLMKQMSIADIHSLSMRERLQTISQKVPRSHF